MVYPNCAGSRRDCGAIGETPELEHPAGDADHGAPRRRGEVHGDGCARRRNFIELRGGAAADAQTRFLLIAYLGKNASQESGNVLIPRC